MKTRVSMLCIMAFIIGCGGGDAPVTPNPNPTDEEHWIVWDQDPLWDDNTALNPAIDIIEYEVYAVRPLAGETFDNAIPCAVVAGVSIDKDGNAIVSDRLKINDIPEVGIYLDNESVMVKMKSVAVDGGIIIDSEMSDAVSVGAINLTFEVIK